jgi:hypothetical protein
VCETRPDVPELDDDLAAGRVHRVGDLAPAGDLRVGIEARRPQIALALPRDLRGFGDDQAGPGALAVIFHVEIVRRVGARRGAVARQRRHDDAVLQFDIAHAEGREQIGGHGACLTKTAARNSRAAGSRAQ